MSTLRLMLVVMFVVLSAYTAVVFLDHGAGLFLVFFSDMAALGWQGQFNLDFMFMLVLSGLWVAWRHNFSPAGIALGLAATMGGIFFMSLYLLIMGSRAGHDPRKLLLGDRA